MGLSVSKQVSQKVNACADGKLSVSKRYPKKEEYAIYILNMHDRREHIAGHFCNNRYARCL